MKIYFFVGRNDRNKSGISCKVWKVEREGRVVSSWWGAATWDRKRRKAVPAASLQSKARPYANNEEAKDAERVLVARKLARGYERKPRRRR